MKRLAGRVQILIAKFPSNAVKLSEKKDEIPQGRVQILIAKFPSNAVKLCEKKDEIQRKYLGEPKITQLNHEINKRVKSQKRKKVD